MVLLHELQVLSVDKLEAVLVAAGHFECVEGTQA
jgi:hypothetical protein